MKIQHRSLPRLRLGTVLIFVALSTLFFSYLWFNSGGTLPFLRAAHYQVTIATTDADNLVYYNDVRMAGVRVGNVAKVDNQPSHALITLDLDSDVAPLHQGATIRIGSKSLVEESYLAITDGTGPELPSGSELPASAVTKSVQLDEVLNSLDPMTRAQLGSTVRSLGSATANQSGAVGQLFTGLGALGRGGRTALDALASQSRELSSLSNNLTTVVRALDTQDGDIATLVSAGERLTEATAGGHTDLDATMRETPGVLHSTATASPKLSQLAEALAPVARDLDVAGPRLSEAFRQLPDATKGLRETMTPLEGVLRSAHPTFDRTDELRDDTQALVPAFDDVLADLNPMLAYLRPYGPDIAGFFTNFGTVNAWGNKDGHWARISLQYNEQALKGNPLDTNVGPIKRSNGYPNAGGSAHPAPFEGVYPRIRRESN